jgi:hypothetical protein
MVVGMDGKIYTVTSGAIRKWDDTTSTNTLVVGNGSGVCADGVAALSCKINVSDTFVDSTGKIYWHEKGIIRTRDTNGNVITIAGQNNFYGDGRQAINARFGTIKSLVVKSNGSIVVLDGSSFRIREFNRSTGQMNLIAGNGSNGIPNTSTSASVQAIPFDIYVDTALIGLLPLTDEVVYNRENAVSKISSSTGKWVDISGNGTTPFTTADGLGINSVKLRVSYYPKILGATGSNLLVALGSFSSGFTDGMLKTYERSTGVQTAFAGLTGVTSTSNWPSDGLTLGTSLFPHGSGVGSMSYDSTTSKWIAYTGGGSIKTLTQGGTIANLFTDPGTSAIRAITSSRASGNLIVYYCAYFSATASYQLKKWDHSTATISTLSWPSSSISCLGNGLAYDSTTNKLIFSFSLNGLQGIAEYVNP